MNTNGARPQGTRLQEASSYSTACLNAFGFPPKQVINLFESGLGYHLDQAGQQTPKINTIVNFPTNYSEMYENLGISSSSFEGDVEGLIDIFNNEQASIDLNKRNQGLLLEFYSRIARKTLYDPRIEFHLNNIYCQDKIVSWREDQNLSTWRRKHCFYSVLRARAGLETVKVFFIDPNSVDTTHDLYEIVENISYHIKHFMNVVIIPSNELLLDGWASVHGDNIGCYIKGVGLYPSKILQLYNVEYNRRWLERFYKNEVPILAKECKCLDLKHSNFTGFAGQIELDRTILNFLPIKVSKSIFIPANDENHSRKRHDNSAKKAKKVPHALQKLARNFDEDEFLQSVEQSKANTPDISFYYDRARGIVEFRREEISLKTLQILAKTDDDCAAVDACRRYEEAPYKNQHDLHILEQLAEKNNPWALLFLGSIHVFFTTRRKNKAAQYFKQAYELGHKIENFNTSLAIGSHGLSSWWCPESFEEGGDEERLIKVFYLLQEGARLGNVYILDRFCEFLYYLFDDQDIQKKARKMLQKLSPSEWGSFASDFVLAKFNYYNNFKTLTCKSIAYQDIVSTIKHGLKITRFAGIPVIHDPLKTTLAFLYWKHDPKKKTEAEAMIRELAANNVVGAAQDFLRLENDTHKYWRIKTFLFSGDAYRVGVKPPDFPDLGKEEQFKGEHRDYFCIQAESEQNSILSLKLSGHLIEKIGARISSSLASDEISEALTTNLERVSDVLEAELKPVLERLATQTEPQLKLPESVPTKWLWENRDKTKKETPEDFLKNDFWRPYFEAGMLYQDVVRHRDKALMKSLDNWCYRKNKKKKESGGKEIVKVKDILRPKTKRIDDEVKDFLNEVEFEHVQRLYGAARKRKYG